MDDLDKKFGELVDYVPAKVPHNLHLEGQRIRLEPLQASHAAALHASYIANGDDTIWDYLPYGPFSTAEDYADWIEVNARAGDPYFFAIYDNSFDCYVGVASYLRINPEMGSIEVGHINFAPFFQRSFGATEVMYLMMRWAFEQGYRRYEWKCNALNLRSRRAAQRLGFSYEGIFRQAAISKGRNRDTAWLAMIDKEWEELDAAFKRWLSPNNFDSDGRQKQSLSEFTSPVLLAIDPAL